MKSKSQTIAEYAILLSVVAVALAGMQVYMRRGIQGVIKVAADEVGKQDDAYETLEDGGSDTDSNTDTSVRSARRKREQPGGIQRKDINDNTTSDTHGTSFSEEDME